MKNSVESKFYLSRCGFGAGLLVMVSAVAMTGCGTYPSWIPSAGPSAEQISNVQSSQDKSGIQVIEVTDAVARRVVASQRRLLFSETLGNAAAKD